MGKSFWEIVMGTVTAKKPAPPPQAAPTKRPKPADGPRSVGVDGMKLSPEDYRRRLSQLGLSLPADAAQPHRPMGANAIETQRAADASRKMVDRAGRAVERQRASEQRDREAEIQPGSFDAHVATADQVRARYAQLGVEPSPGNVYVREVGRPLDARTSADMDHAASSQRDNDRAVAQHVDSALRSGKPVDTKRLTAGEFAALMELRGAGGWTPGC